MIDADLIQLIRLRNTDALMRLMDIYTGSVHSLCRRILAGVGSEEDVEECVSDTFHRAWARIEDYDSKRAPFRTWLLILAKYEALRWRRVLLKQGGRAEELNSITASPLTPEQALVSSEVRTEVQSALASLPALDRELIYRRYFLGESVDALAAEYRLTRQAVDNRFWRGRRALRAILMEAREGVPTGESR